MTGSATQPVSEPPKATIRYTLHRADLLRWQLYGLARHRVLMAFLLVASTFMACLSLREPDMVARSLAFKIAFVVLFDILFLAVVFVLQLVLLGLTILLGKHRGLLGEHVLEIRDDGLLERTDVNESLHRWAGFHKVRATRSYLYLYVTDVLVHIVPLRCFTSPEEARAFQHEIQRHTKAA